MSDGIVIRDGDEMQALGERLASHLEIGDVIFLHGDLGAGKTTLVQGIARGFGVAEAVQSPTFTLVAEHSGRDASGNPVRIYHLDLYRLTDQAELESFGYDAYLRPDDGISLIEWPERADEWLPDRFLLIEIAYRAAGGRVVAFRAFPEESWAIANQVSVQEP